MYYVLKGKTPVSTHDFGDVIALFEDEDKRIVRKTVLKRGQQEVTISTVFLCIDHNYYGEGKPLLFETMIFDNSHTGGEPCYRYNTWEEAEKDHMSIIADFKKHGYGVMEAKKRDSLDEEFEEISRFELMEFEE